MKNTIHKRIKTIPLSYNVQWYFTGDCNDPISPLNAVSLTFTIFFLDLSIHLSFKILSSYSFLPSILPSSFFFLHILLHVVVLSAYFLLCSTLLCLSSLLFLSLLFPLLYSLPPHFFPFLIVFISPFHKLFSYFFSMCLCDLPVYSFAVSISCEHFGCHVFWSTAQRTCALQVAYLLCW